MYVNNTYTTMYYLYISTYVCKQYIYNNVLYIYITYVNNTYITTYYIYISVPTYVNNTYTTMGRKTRP